MYTIHTDTLHRIAYATDASAYREMPIGVAFCEDEKDVSELIAWAKEHHTHLIPRAGGTSIAGQVVGSGLVVDVSKHWNNILEINAEERWVRVQPGVVLDELNLALKPYGLFFSPETSTSNRCCLGGMFGNNSCGSHSLVYGSTRHHVVEARGLLSDGSKEVFKEYTISELENRFGKAFWETESNSLIQDIYAQLIRFAKDKTLVKLIEDNYPDKRLQRRSCGYAIDEVIEGLLDEEKPWSQRSINLCKLLAGSEGTLAFITEIKLHLDPLPPKECVVVCAHCDSLEKSFLANLVALKHHPVAVELMDHNILELSNTNVEQQKNRFFVQGEPAAILMIELKADTREAIDAMAEGVETALRDLCYACTRVYGAETAKVWSLRKAGLGLLNGMKGDAKPIGVIEDTAVIPEYLPDYMKDFGEMLQRLGLECVYHAHIGTGELHLRPIINIKDETDRKRFREVAEETARLVKKYKGSLSGEHGDGRLRGEFIPLMYGDAVYQLMRDVKHCWDADGVFNLHKITDTAPMDSHLRFETNQTYAIEKFIGTDKTYYNWKAAFDECKIKGATGAKTQLNALMCSIEQCNGSGDCRKSNLMGGTLCPAFKVTRDETHATRARANVLREVLTHCNDNPLQSKEIAEVLNSCLACKGCRSECPSNVDMTRLRSEILQHKYDANGTPLRSFAVSRMAAVEKLGHLVWPVYNLFAKWKLSSAIIKGIIRFSTERKIPTLSKLTMREAVKLEQMKARLKQKEAKGKGKVYLFADEFTNFQEAEIGLCFARFLMRLGYEVEIPKHVESGRAAISKGCLKLAKQFAIKNVNMLKDKISAVTPLVGIEPSCILSFRDEYPELVPSEMRAVAQRLGRNALLFDEFIMREVAAGRIKSDDFRSDPVEIWLQGHCPQKALVGVAKTAKALQLLSGATVHVIPSSCCGMAGAFGYEKEHYKTSIAIGEMVLFPTVRKAVANADKEKPTLIAAPGTSCRQQILDGTGIHAAHPIEILQRWLRE